MLRKVLFCVAALLAAAPANAAEWWWITTSGNKPDREIGFMDKSSIAADYSGRISAWDFEIYEILQSDGTRKKKSLYRFDCKARTTTLVELIKYGNNDKLLESFNFKPYEQTDSNIVPESVGEAQWEFACQNKSVTNGPLTAATPEEFAALYFKVVK